jgi:alkylation response protein AidB-like acyl-CoA dehydrogenase
MVPEASGGAGGGLGSLAEACSALGAECASSAVAFLMHSVTAATVAAGGGERAAEVLAGMARGDVLGTLACERGTGAHNERSDSDALPATGHQPFGLMDTGSSFRVHPTR